MSSNLRTIGKAGLGVMTTNAWLAAAACAVAVVCLILAIRCRRAHARAWEELARQSDLIDHLHEGIYRSSLDGRQLSANPALVRLNGYGSEAEMLASVKDIATEWYVEPTRRKEFQEILYRDGRVENFVSEIYRHKTRERIWISESARLVEDRRTGKPLYYEGSVREVTQTIKRLELKERFRKLNRWIPVGLFQFDMEPSGVGKAIYLNGRWEQITGVTKRQLDEGLRITSCIHPEDVETYVSSLQRSAGNMSTWTCEFRFIRPDGEERWLEVRAEPEPANGRIVYHGYLMDVSERKKQDLEITKLAFFDTLTRLPNRRLFFRRLSEAISLRKRRGDLGALLFVDLDNFKSLNDTQGHDVGDAFLIEVASRLRDMISPADVVARIGGDEFVAILNHVGNDPVEAVGLAEGIAARMLASIRAGFSIGPVSHISSASIGIALFDANDARAEDVLKRADIAMYRAKDAGRNAFALFDPRDIELQEMRYRLASELGDALGAGQLELYLQPQIDGYGRMRGGEALLRWNHPERGLVLPDEFLGIAEQFGLASDVEKLVLSEGFAILRSWASSPRTATLRLSLNVSVQSFANDGFLPLVRGLIARYEVDPELVTFEVTEHVNAADQPRIAQCMHALKSLGVRLSLDDFGTGYSSVAYLKQLPFDEIKIDGSFVADIETDENGRALVRAILAMAQSLGLDVVAEHVENPQQQEFLRSLGCDLFQGFLYSAAVPAGRFSKILGAGALARSSASRRAPERSAAESSAP